MRKKLRGKLQDVLLSGEVFCALGKVRVVSEP